MLGPARELVLERIDGRWRAGLPAVMTTTPFFTGNGAYAFLQLSRAKEQARRI
jgi:hypothetical protein